MDPTLGKPRAAAEESFDPYHLRPPASLNRRRVIALRAADPAWVGRTGGDLISKHALVQLVRPQAAALGLVDADPAGYPPRLNACLASADVTVRRTAELIAGEFGRRLGCLVASLLLSPVGPSGPLNAWEAAYMNHWHTQARHVILGGGHASGRLGALIARAAQAALEQCGVEGRTFLAAHFPALLPLIGAGRSLPASLQGQRQAAVLVDCGGTHAKRGVALYDAQNTLVELRHLPELDISRVAAEGTPDELAQTMLALIVETIRAVPAGAALAPHVTVSVAAYVEDGQPVKINRGAYTSLNRVAADVRGWFAEHIRAACGQTAPAAQVEFVHDGGAAACAMAGQGKSAVIMLGSAAGVGFVPPAGGYRRLAEGFAVREI